jgi:hypothetical protein
MPLTIPQLDDRKYQDLLDEALARIPVHTPEWTNFNKGDPGVTVIEVFAFLAENLLYQLNRIPQRNHRKFLSLLGIPLQPGSAAQGLVKLTNERGPLQVITLSDGVEVLAGQVPFRTEQGIDVLPIEGQVFYKKKLSNPSEELKDYYRQLYASYRGEPATPVEFDLYETVPLESIQAAAVDLDDAVDHAFWLALLVRETDKPSGSVTMEGLQEQVRMKLAGKTLSLGIVPAVNEPHRRLSAGGSAIPEEGAFLIFELPVIPEGGGLPPGRQPKYSQLEAKPEGDVLSNPGIVQITLPTAAELKLWAGLEPLEPGVDQFPPPLEDTELNNRLITWIRIGVSKGVRAKFQWVGINATRVKQRAHILNEVLPDGTGEPDQIRMLSKTPVIPGSVILSVTSNGQTKVWKEIEDLLSAGPEVPSPDLRFPPGMKQAPNPTIHVFVLNPESGELRFGDGTHGARLPNGAVVRVDYDYGAGRLGNVNEGEINTSPVLPAGIKVTNPVRTWGGAEAEEVTEGEKQITRYLQHRDRLVSVEDFETIVRRTPGVDINRVEVIPAFNPELLPNEPGDAPGAVTILVIPQNDPEHPDAPVPDRPFLDAICRYVNPRRLVTTELFLQGPEYVDIWVSMGIEVRAGESIAQVREAVKKAVVEFLSPLDRKPEPKNDEFIQTSQSNSTEGIGWPLRKSVVALELVTVASRVPGLLLINEVIIAKGAAEPVSEIPFAGLQLPRVRVTVTIGPALPLDQIRGPAGGVGPTRPPKVVAVPVIPEECK